MSLSDGESGSLAPTKKRKSQCQHSDMASRELLIGKSLTFQSLTRPRKSDMLPTSHLRLRQKERPKSLLAIRNSSSRDNLSTTTTTRSSTRARWS